MGADATGAPGGPAGFDGGATLVIIIVPLNFAGAFAAVILISVAHETHFVASSVLGVPQLGQKTVTLFSVCRRTLWYQSGQSRRTVARTSAGVQRLALL